MSASTAQIGAGSFLQLNTGGGLVTVAEVKDINGEQELGTAKATHLLSPGVMVEKKPAWLDPGKVTIQANFTKAQYAILYAAQQARAIYAWTITTGGGSIATFSGHITKLGMNIPLEEVIEMPFDIDITGFPAPTFTA